jgi:hypothetical protein
VSLPAFAQILACMSGAPVGSTGRTPSLRPFSFIVLGLCSVSSVAEPLRCLRPPLFRWPMATLRRMSSSTLNVGQIPASSSRPELLLVVVGPLAVCSATPRSAAFTWSPLSPCFVGCATLRLTTLAWASMRSLYWAMGLRHSLPAVIVLTIGFRASTLTTPPSTTLVWVASATPVNCLTSPLVAATTTSPLSSTIALLAIISVTSTATVSGVWNVTCDPGAAALDRRTCRLPPFVVVTLT